MDTGSKLNMSFLEGKYTQLFAWIITVNIISMLAMLVLLLFQRGAIQTACSPMYERYKKMDDKKMDVIIQELVTK